MTEHKEAGELLPCPFCASKDLTLTIDHFGWKVVQCDDCGASGPCIDLEGDRYIARWNTRLAATRPQADPVAWISDVALESLKRGEYATARGIAGLYPNEVALYAAPPSPPADAVREIDEVIAALGTATTQTGIEVERRYEAHRKVLSYLQNRRAALTPDAGDRG